MSIHTTVTTPGIYFITFTNYQWTPLLQLVNGYDLVYNWFDILSNNGHWVNAYVVMPNHLHLLLYFAGAKQSLNTIVGNGKRFMAYEIIKRLASMDETAVLKRLEAAVLPKEREKGKKHQVWEESFDVKECRTERFVMQKLIYIHNNPCSGKWSLAKTIIDYPHSSASFYITGKHSAYAVKDYRDFMIFDEESDR